MPNQTASTPEARAAELGFPIPEGNAAAWPYTLFDPWVTADDTLYEFSGIPGRAADGTLVKGLYVPDGGLSMEAVGDAGVRALAFGLAQLKAGGRYRLEEFQPFKLQVMIGAAPGTPGLGMIANRLSKYLLEVLGVPEDDTAGRKGIRATFGVSMEFAIEPVMTLVRPLG